MNKLEERHYKEWDESNVTKQAKAHAAITKEVAIGFKLWRDGIWSNKPESELFEMYLNTLK